MCGNVPCRGYRTVSGGFRLFLQDLQAAEPSCRDLDDDSSPLMLSTRQRFTFAHEIVHTFFYDCREAVPARLDTPKGPEVGDVVPRWCQTDLAA